MVDIKDLSKATVSFFRSRKLTLVLVILLIIFSFLGTIIPQQPQLKPFVYESWKDNSQWSGVYEGLVLTDVYSSPAFTVLILFFFLNTLFCTSNMLKVAFKRCGRVVFRGRSVIETMENHSEIGMDGSVEQVVEDVGSVLRKKRYSVRREGNRIHAEKNRFGVFGTPLFHVCILIVLLAVFGGKVGRMEGAMELVEGQMLTEDHRNYVLLNEGPLFGEVHQGFGVHLDKFYPDYSDVDGAPRGMASKLSIIEDDQIVDGGMVYSNRQIVYRGVTIYQNEYGFAPLLILKDKDGRDITGSYVVTKDETGTGIYASSFFAGDTGIEGDVVVYPGVLDGYSSEFGIDIPDEPLINLRLHVGEQDIFNGTLGLNETVDMGDVSVGFYEIKYWSRFYLVKDKGAYVVFAGLFFGVIGLAVAFFMVPMHIFVEVTGGSKGGGDVKNAKTVVFMGGSVDRFNAPFEGEYLALVENIGTAIKESNT
ncbi:MAG: cytochrome c biogenesis protein ResB [Methanosarcinaceae archaeon]|nr:cytochrome c biogenesis protein ResB [Methanosarcinaceae archaeon]